MARYLISGISVSPQGGRIAKEILGVLENEKNNTDLSVKWYHRPDAPDTDDPQFISMEESLTEWTANRFQDSTILIFIGNLSRVFMLTAPYVPEYANNMTILVIDEHGKFCVPLLSGRRNEGGKFAEIFEKKLGITAVDMLSSKKGYDFSIERFAKENRMTISNKDYAREIMTSLHAGETVGIYTNYRFTGALPMGMEFRDSGEKGIYISPSFHNAYFNRTLWLIPRCMIVDFECPPDTLSHSLLVAIDTVFRELNLFQEAIEIIRVPQAFIDDSLLNLFCGDRDIKLTVLTSSENVSLSDVRGYKYQPICDMALEENIRCRVAMKNIVLSFLG